MEITSCIVLALIILGIYRLYFDRKKKKEKKQLELAIKLFLNGQAKKEKIIDEQYFFEKIYDILYSNKKIYDEINFFKKHQIHQIILYISNALKQAGINDINREPILIAKFISFFLEKKLINLLYDVYYQYSTESNGNYNDNFPKRPILPQIIVYNDEVGVYFKKIDNNWFNCKTNLKVLSATFVKTLEKIASR